MTHRPTTRGASWGSRPRRLAALLLAAGTLSPVMTQMGTVHASSYDPATDNYSMQDITQLSGATAWWNAGYTGAGIDVALIDTGVSPVDGLATAGKLVHGPDLSLESQAPHLTRLDTNGHGTFMAGLIAGKDASLTAPYANAPASSYRGMAPDARIISLKVGIADGGVDVSQVIAAVDWVVQHKNSDGLNIRVLNLSYGTNSTQDALLDPLSFAVERAWKAGIVVVVAGGNYGFQSQNRQTPALANPAVNRNVIAVGSAETNGTTTMSDDGVPAFSPWPKFGSMRSVDIVAPGTHLQGLRVPNSFIDANYPGGRLGARYFRGTGTSHSAALVSGAAALILDKFPNATPDQVKRLMTLSGVPISGNVKGYGAGELNLATTLGLALPAFTQTWPTATGTGSLELARGSDRLTMNGDVLNGEIDIMGKPFNSAAMAPLTIAATTWSGGTWNGSTWSGSSWSGSSWSGSSWSGSSWSGSSWSGSSWSGSTWSGSSWSGSSWSGSSWSGSSWSGSSWSGSSWSGSSWS